MPATPALTGQDIAEAQGAVSGLLNSLLDGGGNEYVTLRVVAFRGPWPNRSALQSYLAGQPQLCLDAAGAADLLDGLARKNLASGLDGDGPVQLTREGSDLYAGLAERIQATTSQLYSGFDHADLATTPTVLAEITERANRLRDNH